MVSVAAMLISALAEPMSAAVTTVRILYNDPNGNVVTSSEIVPPESAM
jgi:hypothetical protein